MKKSYSIPWYNRLARAIILPLFRIIFDSLSDLKLDGLENIPKNGPYLVIFNHVSLYDAPVVISHLPVAPEVLGASDVWNKPGQDLLARAYGGIPIHRGEVDRTAMYQMLAVLDAGLPLCMAPEGGRSHTPGMRRAKPGISFILEKYDLPIIPIGVEGTTEDYVSKMFQWKKPVVNMIVGKPFTVPAEIGKDASRADAYQQRADYIMQKLAALLPEEYRGYYR